MNLLLHHLWQWLQRSLKILHQLWLEVTGFIFLALAAFGTLSAWREWNAYRTGGALWELVAAVCFVLMMASFGIYSFLKSRRLR
jgi:hypothetical protein